MSEDGDAICVKCKKRKGDHVYPEFRSLSIKIPALLCPEFIVVEGFYQMYEPYVFDERRN